MNGARGDMNAKHCSRVVHRYMQRTVRRDQFGWNPTVVRAFTRIEVVHHQALDDDLGLVRPRGAPDDEAEDGEEQDEGEEAQDDLAAAGEAAVAGEVLVGPLLLDDVALGPALVVERLALPAGALPEVPREAADGGGARVAAVGWVRRRLVGAVEHRRGLHRRGLVPAVVRLPRRALHVVVVAPADPAGPLRRPRRRRRRPLLKSM